MTRSIAVAGDAAQVPGGGAPRAGEEPAGQQLAADLPLGPAPDPEAPAGPGGWPGEAGHLLLWVAQPRLHRVC